MVKIVSDERNSLIMYLTDLQGQHQNDHNLESFVEILTKGKTDKTPEVSKIDEDGSINLHVNHLYDLYHYTVSLGSQKNQRREGILKTLNLKLNALLKDVPQFFKDAFENRELYLYCNDNKDLFSFLKNNILFPIFHKDNGIVRECKELEDIIQIRHNEQNNDYPTIERKINEEIERINGLITNPPQLDFTEQEKQKLPFFDLLKSMISPKVARDKKYDYEFLTSTINLKLEHKQSRFRAVQLKENKDLGAQDHRLGIDWNGNNHSNRTNKSLFSHVHPACLSEMEDYNSSNIKIKDENGITKTLDHFIQEYLEVIKERYRIKEITTSSNYTSELHSHIFLAEDRKNTNLSSEQKEHARLKLECKAPRYEDNVYNQNFFIRMAFEPTEEPYVYKMTKEGRDEYHHNMIFYKSSFENKDSDYVYAADDIIEVTEIADSTYKEAISSVCGKIIKQADQKSYLTMTMHLVPTGARRQTSNLEMVGRLIPRGSINMSDGDDLECDGQSSHSRIDAVSNPNAQNLPKGRLKADYFRIQSINFNRVLALVANKELYQVSTKSEQPVENCIEAMKKKMNRVTGKANNLPNPMISSAPPQSPCSTGSASPLIGATGGIHSPQCLDFSNINQHLEENLSIPNTPSPTSHLSRSSSPECNFELDPAYYNFNDSRLLKENDESFGSLSSSLSSIEVLEYDNEKSNIR